MLKADIDDLPPVRDGGPFGQVDFRQSDRISDESASSCGDKFITSGRQSTLRYVF